jgi:hypothetical protein
MINFSRVTDRTLLVLLSSSVGGVVSMAALRILHEWAFRTEFNRWLWLTAVHSCIYFQPENVRQNCVLATRSQTH